MTRRGFPSRLHLTLGLLAVVISSLAGVGASSAVAATSAPAWRVSPVANPTAFSSKDTTNPPAGECAPCDKYQLRLTNVGHAPSNGTPITVTDTLPAGVTTSGTAPRATKKDEWCCTPTGEGQSTRRMHDFRNGGRAQAGPVAHRVSYRWHRNPACRPTACALMW